LFPFHLLVLQTPHTVASATGRASGPSCQKE
jgi:hypothetical protein